MVCVRWYNSDPVPNVALGALVTVYGKVVVYKGMLQLRVYKICILSHYMSPCPCTVLRVYLVFVCVDLSSWSHSCRGRPQCRGVPHGKCRPPQNICVQQAVSATGHRLEARLLHSTTVHSDTTPPVVLASHSGVEHCVRIPTPIVQQCTGTWTHHSRVAAQGRCVE